MATVEEKTGEAPAPSDASAAVGGFLLRGIGWEGYQKLLEIVGDSSVRITYENGDAELMSPGMIHERLKMRVDMLIGLISQELRLPFISYGSTTFHSKAQNVGLEPDQCYYLSRLERISNPDELDVRRDPPPDVAVEIDISRNSRARLRIYAGLGVPEVWRCMETGIEVLELHGQRVYRPAKGSQFWPFVPLIEFSELLHRRGYPHEMAWKDDALTWVRETVAPEHATWKAEAEGRG